MLKQRQRLAVFAVRDLRFQLARPDADAEGQGHEQQRSPKYRLPQDVIDHTVEGRVNGGATLDRLGLDSWLRDEKRVPLVMGVLNVTPDSFSDGGRFAAPEDAVAAALEMEAAGADILDIGGESTRPGALPVAAEEQIARVLPAIAAIRRKSSIAISIDTTQWPVAAAALDAGADCVNDVSAGRDHPDMLAGVARRGVPIILMHMRGTPGTMQENPTYRDVIGEIRAFLTERMNAALAAGIERHRILLDPGIGFGKTTEHDLTILRDLRQFVSIGRPLVVGVSRKKFIGRILDQPDVKQRLLGTAAAVAWSVANGAAVVRVHDVGPINEVVRMVCAIREGTDARRHERTK